MTEVRLIHGSALHIPVEDESVQTCVTSPPYWGLRQYAGEQVVPEWGCALGLEPTPELYVEHMVEIFREVRRVLRKDGTLWLNLGSSYAGGGNGGGGSFASERPGWSLFGGRRAERSGSDGTARSGSSASDSASRSLCDGCADALALRSPDSDENRDRGLPASAAESNRSRTGSRPDRGGSSGSASPGVRSASGTSGRRSALPSADASPLDAQESTMPESGQQPRGQCSHCANCGACLDVLASASRDSRVCARTAEYTSGTSSLASGNRNSGTDVSGMAWLNYTRSLGPKQLVPIPWMVAMALQQDGWILRCDVIWSKPAPMPESVRDRPTKSHEYLFLLSKSPSYYYDSEAVREPLSEGSLARVAQPTFATQTGGEKDYGPDSNRSARRGLENLKAAVEEGRSGRNKRSVWTINTQPYSGSHFAVFPEALVEPCILAGSSPKACGVCGAPWERVTNVERDGDSLRNPQKLDALATNGVIKGGTSGRRLGPDVQDSRKTTGWRSTCDHDDDTGASVVLDPFNGSGTTGRVAVRHGRSYVGVDISKEYLDEQAVRRIYGVQMEAAL